MTAGFQEEFSTIDLVLASGAETAGVDGFALSLIKSERQVRKLFTYLVYQSSAFSPKDVRQLRETLAACTSVYFEGIVKGLNALSPVSVKQLVGPEYPRLWPRFKEFAQHRNKIFHGQITAKGLSRAQLLKNVSDIHVWCDSLGAGAERELGYDGFGRNSFRKSSVTNLENLPSVRLESISQYAHFIRTLMSRNK
jgi:hypothetical protein